MSPVEAQRTGPAVSSRARHQIHAHQYQLIVRQARRRHADGGPFPHRGPCGRPGHLGRHFGNLFRERSLRRDRRALVRTFANTGAEFRFGLNLPDDFGTAAIGSSSTTSNPVDGEQAADRSRFDLGMYLFARVDGRLVGHDIFLDGNTFDDSHSVDSKLFVADLSAGVAFNIKNTKMSYALVYRTEEFDGQDEGQVFGTMSFNWTF